MATDLSSKTPLSTSSVDDLWLEKVRAWAGALPDVLPIELVESGRRSTVAGVVQSTRIDPVSRTIEAVVTDGIGSIRVRWPLARPISEHAPVPHRAVLMTGLAVATGAGGLALERPAWTRIPGPDEA